jgi:hypothetical protein
MSDIEKARDAIYQKLLVQQGPMSRKVVKSIMEDIDALIKLYKEHECSCKDQPIAHWSASTWGHHECSCGCFSYTTEGGDGESLESCRKEDE